MERIGVSDFGVNLYTMVFETMDELVEGDLKLEAVTELENRVPGLRVIDVSFKEHDWLEATVVCSVSYAMPLSPPRTVEFNVSTLLTEETAL